MGRRDDGGPSADVAEIRDQIEAWAEAIRSNHVEKVLAHHADDFVLFDVPPLRSPSGSTRTEGRGRTRSFRLGEAGTFDISELEIRAGEEVAYCHGLIRRSGTDAGAAPRSWSCG